MVQACFVVQAAVVGQAFQPAAGLRAGLGAPYRPPLLVPIAPYSAATLRVRPSWTLPHRPLRGARSPACHTGCSRGASRQACHAGFSVEHAARLAMPAVTPAERHNPEWYGSSNAIRPARLRAPLQPAAAKWSKPPGLPCRRSRRQSHTIPNGTGGPNANRRQDWWRGPHDCALHLQPLPSSHLRALRGLFFSVSSVSSVVCFSPCPPCPLWFAFSVFSVVCFICALRVVSDVGQAF